MALVVVVVAADAPLVAKLREHAHVVVHASAPEAIPAEVDPDVVLISAELSIAARESLEGRFGGRPSHIVGSEPIDATLAWLRSREPAGLLRLKAVSVDLRRARVYRDGVPTELTDKEVALLSWLVAHPDRAIPRDELLAKVWGYREGVVTRTIDNTVRRLRVKIEADAASPDHVLTEVGSGYRFAPPEQWAPAAAPAPAVAAPTQTPSAGFIGRSTELSALAAAFDANAQLVLLIGPPGVGKTRTARESLQGRIHTWVELDGVTTDTGLVAAIADALSLGVDADPARVLAALGGLPGVLALDNFEQLAPHAGLLVGLAEALPGPVLVTSRVRTNLPGEVVVELGPLPVAEALTLLEAHAQTRRPGWLTIPRERTAAEALVQQLDGMPLAIELAAAKARTLSASDLLERLRRGLDALSGAVPGRSGPRATLRGSIATSWDLLTTSERAALAQLSLFRAPFSPLDAEAVLDVPEPLDTLESLLDRSLVASRQDPDGSVRLGLYVAIRAFAAEQLAAADPAHGRFLDWLESTALREAATADAPDPDLAGDGADPFAALAALHRLRTELSAIARMAAPRATSLVVALAPLFETHGVDPDLRKLALTLGLDAAVLVEPPDEVLRDALRADSPTTRARAAIALAARLRVAGSAAEARALLQAPDLAGLPPPVVARLQIGLARLFIGLGELDDAERLASSALHLCLTRGPARLISPARLVHADVLRLRARAEEAVSAYRSALQAARRSADRAGEMRARLGLAVSLHHIGQSEAALAELDPAIELARRLGLRRDEGQGNVHRGLIASDLCRADPALAAFQRALDIALSLADRELEAAARAGVARAWADKGELAAAVREHRASIEVYGQLGATLGRGIALGNLASVHQEQGDHEAAAEAYRQAIAALEAHPVPQTYFRSALGELLLEQGALVEAVDCLEACTAALDQNEHGWVAGAAFCWLAVAYVRSADLPSARWAFAVAHDRLASGGNPALLAALRVYEAHTLPRDAAEAVLAEVSAGADPLIKRSAPVRDAARHLRRWLDTPAV